MKEFSEVLISNFSKVFQENFAFIEYLNTDLKYTLNWIISLNLSIMIESPKSIQKVFDKNFPIQSKSETF